MSTTTTTNLALIKPTAGTNEPASIFTSHNPNMDKIDLHDHGATLGAPIKRIQSGTFAARPAAGNAGHVYVATDTPGIYYDTGTAWVEASSPAGAQTLTNKTISLLAGTGNTLLVPAAHAYHSVSQAVASSGLVVLALNSERYDTDTMHDLATNNSRLTCKTAGSYAVKAGLEWAGNATGERITELTLNGAITIARVRGAAGLVNQNPSTTYALAVNDYVELRVYQDSGVALNITVQANYSPYLCMERVA